MSLLDFYSVHPFVYFDVLHLESLTVWICMGSTLRHIPYKIAYSFVTRTGPKSLGSNALTAADVAVAAVCFFYNQ